MQEPAWFRAFDRFLAAVFVVALLLCWHSLDSEADILRGPCFSLLAVVLVGIFALRIWRHRWRVRILDRRRQALNDAMKARLLELRRDDGGTGDQRGDRTGIA